MRKTVYSFDVFDTSLVRIWAKPTHLFWELGYQLQKENLIQISPESWSELRTSSETNLRKTGPFDEVTLEEIYEYLAPSLNWSTDEVQKAKQKEIEIELLSLRPVPAIQKKIQSLHQANEQIIFMSDMYLSEEVIRNFLKENYVWAPGSTLYVSSKTRINKVSGQLFQYCLTQHSLKPSRLTHVGDNLKSDVKIPKRLGVKVEPFTLTHLNRYEQLIADQPQLPLRFRSLLAGMSRLTRLQSQQTSSDKQTIWDTTASVIAPILFSFIYWCLVEAKKKGIKRLYFVARDGQIMHKIAQVICLNWGYDIDCRYLYGSRQAWHAPSIMEIGETEFSWIFDSTTFLSVHSVCERVNLTPEQIENVLIRFGFPQAKWNLNLNREERKQLKQAFHDPQVIELILSTAADYREKAIGYFRQEKLGNDLPFAIVDIGWVGRAQRSFSQLLKSAGLYPESGIHGFYFALEKERKALPTDHLLAFYDVSKPDRQHISQHRHLFELFVTADHGGTMRYEQFDHQYAPILRYQKNEKAISWGLYVLQDAAVEFARQMTTNLNESDCAIDQFLKATDLLIESFVYNPSALEAKVFGSFLIADDQGENVLYELAPAYSWVNYFKLLIFGKQPFKGVWFPASLARSHPLVRILLNPSILNVTHNLRVAVGRLKRSLAKSQSKPA